MSSPSPDQHPQLDAIQSGVDQVVQNTGETTQGVRDLGGAMVGLTTEVGEVRHDVQAVGGEVRAVGDAVRDVDTHIVDVESAVGRVDTEVGNMHGTLQTHAADTDLGLRAVHSAVTSVEGTVAAHGAAMTRELRDLTAALTPARGGAGGAASPPDLARHAGVRGRPLGHSGHTWDVAQPYTARDYRIPVPPEPMVERIGDMRRRGVQHTREGWARMRGGLQRIRRGQWVRGAGHTVAGAANTVAGAVHTTFGALRTPSDATLSVVTRGRELQTNPNTLWIARQLGGWALRGAGMLLTIPAAAAYPPAIRRIWAGIYPRTAPTPPSHGANTRRLGRRGSVTTHYQA
jgi:hypothetical protein